MLTKLYRYDRIGSSSELFYVFKNILSESPKNINNIITFCLDNPNMYNIPIKGILKFLEYISLVEIENNKLILLSNEAKKLNLKKYDDEEKFSELLVFLTVKKIFKEFLTSEDVKFDIKTECFVVKNSEFPIKYANVRNLLINLKFFFLNPNNINILQINPSFNNLLKSIVEEKRKKMSIEDLKAIQRVQEKVGREAEVFVLDYEKKRLKDHPKTAKILRISDVDVSAGYDIVSFMTSDSKEYDRFIEVKSYNNKPNFYWTENEKSKAEKYKNNYFLYLVDRTKVSNKNYKPIIIENPYENVFLSNHMWVKEPTEWYIIPK